MDLQKEYPEGRKTKMIKNLWQVFSENLIQAEDLSYLYNTFFNYSSFVVGAKKKLAFFTPFN